ncbi:MAG: hypothetical protein AB8G05_24330 [Oligoflexales bacterium]
MRQQRNNEAIKSLLGHMYAHRDRLLLVKPLDDGESRNEFIKVLQCDRAPEIDKNLLKFAASKQAIEGFRNMVKMISQEGNRALSDYKRHDNDIIDHFENIKRLEEEKTLLITAFKDVETGDTDKAKTNFRELAEQSNNQMESLRKKINKANEVILAYQDKINDSNDGRVEEYETIKGSIQQKGRFKKSWKPAVLTYRGPGPVTYNVHPETKKGIGIWEDSNSFNDGETKVFSKKYIPIRPDKTEISMTISIPHKKKPDVVALREEWQDQLENLKKNKEELNHTLGRETSAHETYLEQSTNQEIAKSSKKALAEQLQLNIGPILEEIETRENKIPILKEQKLTLRGDIWKRRNDFDFIQELAFLFEFNEEPILDFLKNWRNFLDTEEPPENSDAEETHVTEPYF